MALCYDANTGKELWRNVVSEGSELKWDNKSNLALPIFGKVTGAQIPVDGGNDRVI